MRDVLLAGILLFTVAVGFVAAPLVGAFVATLMGPLFVLVVLIIVIKLWREEKANVTNREE
jgi:hypothetical protein